MGFILGEKGLKYSFKAKTNFFLLNEQYKISVCYFKVQYQDLQQIYKNLNQEKI